MNNFIRINVPIEIQEQIIYDFLNLKDNMITTLSKKYGYSAYKINTIINNKLFVK